MDKPHWHHGIWLSKAVMVKLVIVSTMESNNLTKKVNLRWGMKVAGKWSWGNMDKLLDNVMSKTSNTAPNRICQIAQKLTM